MELKAVLKPGSRFGHEARGVDTAVPQAAGIREMSLEFFPVSSAGESRCRGEEGDCNITTEIERVIQSKRWFVDNTDTVIKITQKHFYEIETGYNYNKKKKKEKEMMTMVVYFTIKCLALFAICGGQGISCLCSNDNTH